MARWLVTQGDHQFSAADLNELKQLAQSGSVGPGDMVQPPGTSDWLYASELPELNELFGAQPDDDDDWEMPKTRNRTLAVVLLGLVAAGGYGMWDYGQKLPSHEDLEIIGGTTGMALTERSPRREPHSVGTVRRRFDSGLHRQRRDPPTARQARLYNVRNASGAEGFVPSNTVVPAYYFADAETRQSYDPIYNPDRYVFVKNNLVDALPDQRRQRHHFPVLAAEQEQVSDDRHSVAGHHQGQK